jgi:hypothetical protein
MITDFPKENQGVRQALITSDSLQNPLVTADGERGTKICSQVFLAEGMGIEKDPSRADEHIWDDAYGLSQIKIWLHRFRTGDRLCSDLRRGGQPPLTLGPQVDAFLQKYPFASARMI